MAVDEALLEEAIQNGQATLRLYRWQEPTLSLGYFQSYSDRCLHAESMKCPCVRRLSGGGAIVHDQELTYSLALPASSAIRHDPNRYYKAAHQGIVAVLRKTVMGSNSRFRFCEAAIDRPVSSEQNQETGEFIEPFLCFQRRADLDVLLSVEPTLTNEREPKQNQGGHSHKVVGSAQRKRRGALLQHGSILLRKSAAAPQLHGVADFSHVEATDEQIGEAIVSMLAQELDLQLLAQDLTPQLRRHADRLRKDRFAKGAWAERR